METTEALDHELIIERAEAIRLWLLGLHLSNRATSAVQRELGAIIDNDPGNYINGQRPLAGLTIADFISELHHPDGGAVGRVKNVGFAALKELRERIPADADIAHAEPDYTIPDLDYTIPDLIAPPPAPDLVEATPVHATEAPPARRRGRPKGSKNTRRKVTVTSQPAAPPVAPPAAPPVAPAPPSEDDRMLQQLARLWPTLHPQARRAVLTYASELWAEGGYAV